MGIPPVPPLPPPTSSASGRPARGPPLSPLLPPNQLAPSPRPPGISDAENRLRTLIAEQTRLSPLEELARRSVIEGRQSSGKTGSAMIDGLERLLRETGDLQSVEQLRDANEDGGDDDTSDCHGATDAVLGSPVTARESPAGLPMRPLPAVPPSSTTPVAMDRSRSGSPWQMQHLLPPPSLVPPSASPSDDEPALPPSPELQAGTSPVGAAAEDINDLYSRPTERRTRLSTLGPKIRRDGPAPWEEEGFDDVEGDLPTMADLKLLRPSRSSPDFKDEPDGADDVGKGKRAWISSLGRRKKDREGDDASAAWKALGYAPPSPSVFHPSSPPLRNFTHKLISLLTRSVPSIGRRPSESSIPPSPQTSRYPVEPPSPGFSQGGDAFVDRHLKPRRSASNGLRKIFAKSPGAQAPDAAPIHEISAPLPTPPPANAVPIPQALLQATEDSVRPAISRSTSATSSSSSPPHPTSPVVRRRPPRLGASPSSASLLANGQDYNLELRPVSMAFSAKFSDHLQSPTSPDFDGDALSPRSAHGFGGVLNPPASSSTTEGEPALPTPRNIGLGTRRPSQSAVKKAAIAEEEEDEEGDDKDALIRSLRLELEGERDLRRRVVEDYEVRPISPWTVLEPSS
jgi:hypothetical protein